MALSKKILNKINKKKGSELDWILSIIDKDGEGIPVFLK